MLVLEGSPQHQRLIKVDGVENCYSYIKLVHNAPVQFTEDVYRIYEAYPKFIMLNIMYVHFNDLFKNSRSEGVRASSCHKAIEMLSDLKDEYYIVRDLGCGNFGNINMDVVSIHDTYLSGQPLQLLRYNIIDEILEDL